MRREPVSIEPEADGATIGLERLASPTAVGTLRMNFTGPRHFPALQRLNAVLAFVATSDERPRTARNDCVRDSHYGVKV